MSDAGDDLAYLFFYKNGGDESARLEGFVTSDEFYQRDLDKAHDPEKVKLPAAGVILELNSGQGRRYAESDRDGRFVFDGLAGGEYRVSVFDAGYPEHVKLLAGPAIVTLFAAESVRSLITKFAPRTVLKLAAPVAAKVTDVGVPGGTTVFTVPPASEVQLALPPETVFHLLPRPPFQ